MLGRFIGLGGVLGGLGALLEKLGELAEKGKELSESGEIEGEGGQVRGVYGFTIRSGTGKDSGEVKVEPFGNVRKDAQTGRPVVHETREPMVDVFEEDDRVVVVAEMPGVEEGDVRLELVGDVLTLTASKGERKYRKEVLLPGEFAAERMTHTCRNGILEVRLARGRVGS